MCAPENASNLGKFQSAGRKGEFGMQKKKRINTADIIIITAVLAIICIIIFRNPLKNTFEKSLSDTEIEYDILVKKNDVNISEFLTDGNTIYDAESDIPLGQVVSCTASVSYDYELSENNEFEKVLLHDKYDILITVRSKGSYDSFGKYILGQWFVSPGKNVAFYTSEASACGIIRSVSTVK